MLIIIYQRKIRTNIKKHKIEEYILENNNNMNINILLDNIKTKKMLSNI